MRLLKHLPTNKVRASSQREPTRREESNMKKISILLILFFSVINLYPQSSEVLDIKMAYLYMEEELLISETDLYCTFYIGQKMKKDTIISDAVIGDGKVEFSDGDKLYMNKGAKDGIKVGDQFMPILKGKKIRNPFSGKSLGFYYLKKSMVEVLTVYDELAIIEVKKGCNPVNIGDILIPFEKEQTVFKKRIEYTKAILPDSEIEGRVVYNDLFPGLQKEMASNAAFLAIDLGKAVLKRGDYVIFYKKYKKKLPPVIKGTGIVLHTENTNSTIKILDSSGPIEVGMSAILLPEEKEALFETDEDIPIVEGEEGVAAEGQKTLEKSVLFSLDGFKVDPQYKGDFDELQTFISDKSQYIIILRGYTCSIGREEYNLELSQKRVETVKDYLMKEYNIEEKFIKTSFYGEKGAPFDNSSEEQRRKNRLVSIQVTGK
jgi:outer membrane protein OmpA-like peptidoglycan-associated protein